MIKVFNGDWRGLDGAGKHISINIDVEFRDIIRHFHGSMLHVFLAVILHSNPDGASWPSYDLLEQETGYGRDTIAAALKKLCALRLNGRRVLLRYRAHNEDGQFIDGNQYLIFPTEEEIQKFTTVGKNPTLDKTNSGKSELEENTSPQLTTSLREQRNLIFETLHFYLLDATYVRGVTKVGNGIAGQINRMVKYVMQVKDWSIEDVRGHYDDLKKAGLDATRSPNKLQMDIQKRVNARRERGEQAAAILDNEGQVFEDYERLGYSEQ